MSTQLRNNPHFAEAETLDFEEIKPANLPVIQPRQILLERLKNRIPAINPQAAKIVFSELAIVSVRLVFWGFVLFLGLIVFVLEFLLGLIRREPNDKIKRPENVRREVNVSVNVEIHN